MRITQPLKIQGYLVRAQVIDKGIVVRECGEKPNLITNAGRNMVFSGLSGTRYSLAQCLGHGHVGSDGSTPLVTNPKLIAWVKSTSTVLPGAGNCGTEWDPATGVMTFTKTFDFSAETVGQVYREFGVGPVSGDSTTLNRLTFPTDMAVGVGQQLRVVFKLVITFAPAAVSAVNPVISGWNTAGTNRLNSNFSGTGTDNFLTQWILTDGSVYPTTGTVNTGHLQIPQISGKAGSGLNTIQVNDSSRLRVGSSDLGGWPAFGTFQALTGELAPANGSLTVAESAYVTDSFYRDVVWTLSPSAWASNQNVAWLQVGGLLMKFDVPQAKANTHRLAITHRVVLS